MSTRQLTHALPEIGLCAALLGLMASNVGLAYAPLGVDHLAVSLGVAVLQASVVLVFFMRLRSAGGLIRLAAVAGVLWLAVLMILTFADILTRS